MEYGSERQKKIAQMEREIRQNVEEIERRSPDHLYRRLQMQFHDWDYEEKSITVRYPVLDWELNHMKSMHGGIIASAIDTTSGIATSHFTGHVMTPTINLNINYLSPALEGDAMLVTTGELDHNLSVRDDWKADCNSHGKFYADRIKIRE